MNDQMQLGENSKNGALGGNSMVLQGHGKENFNGPLDPTHLSECHSQLCHQLYWQQKFKSLSVLAS